MIVGDNENYYPLRAVEISLCGTDVTEKKAKCMCGFLKFRKKNLLCFNGAALQAITTKARFTQDHLMRLNHPQYRKTSVFEVTEVRSAIRRAEARL